MPGISIMRRDHDGRVIFGLSMRIRPPEWPSFSGREKNWSPFVYNDTVYFIKSINPLVVVGVREMDTVLTQFINMTTSNDLVEKIGSTFVVSTASYIPGTCSILSTLVVNRCQDTLLIHITPFTHYYHHPNTLSHYNT